MGRHREYESDAERARAWRQRRQEELERLRQQAGTTPPPRFHHKGPKEFRITLARVLGMLSSDNAHQRDVAALKATELQRKSGLSWYDLLGVKEPELPTK